MLAEADTIQKAKELKSLALTAAEWAKRKNMGEEAIQHCRSYALEAERKMGQMLRETERADGGDAQRTRLRHVTESPPTLSALGLSKRESAEAQLLAELSEATRTRSLIYDATPSTYAQRKGIVVRRHVADFYENA